MTSAPSAPPRSPVEAARAAGMTASARPRLSLDELAARGIRPGASVADMRVRWPFRYGICLDVPGPSLIGVRWTDGAYEQVDETRIGVTGYILSPRELACLKYGRPTTGAPVAATSSGNEIARR
jgi:hypothetical protein